MGHTGTLDPLASGCMVVATGKSTKLLHLMQNAKKTYRVTYKFDGYTRSLDLDTPIERGNDPLPQIQAKNPGEIASFLMRQKSQIPPLYSALHVDGKRAYELARSGSNKVLKERPIEVFQVQNILQSGETLTLDITVSSGCYVRSFAPVLGEYLGRPGYGYVSELTRTHIHHTYGDISLDDACNLSNLKPISVYQIFHTFPTIDLTIDMYNNIRVGKSIIYKTGKKFTDGSYIFARYGDYMSLLIAQNGFLHIVRNDIVSSSHVLYEK